MTLEFNCALLCMFISRGYYIVVVPLKKQRTGKFFKPWDNPDEMNLEEVGAKNVPLTVTQSIGLCALATHFFSQNLGEWGIS